MLDHEYTIRKRLTTYTDLPPTAIEDVIRELHNLNMITDELMLTEDEATDRAEDAYKDGHDEGYRDGYEEAANKARKILDDYL